MRASTIASSIFGAAGIASAMQFNSPAANSTITRGQTLRDVSWSTVDTDPGTFSIYLVNFVNWPPYYKQLAANIETASGATQVRIPCDLDVSGGYQLNAVNGTNVYVIYAQTPKFNIGGASCKDPAAATETTCTAAPAVTVTATVTVSPSKFSYPVSNGTAINHSTPGVTAAAVLPTTTSTTPRVPPATCPDTIGWGPAGYGAPVTLTAPPRPTMTPGPYVVNAAAFGASSSTYSTSIVYETVGSMVYKNIYRDYSEYKGDGSCACNA